MKTIEEIIAFIRSLANDKTEIIPNWNEIADQLYFAHMRLINKESHLEEQLKKLKSELGEAAKWTRSELNRELAQVVVRNNELVAKISELTCEKDQLVSEVIRLTTIKDCQELDALDDHVKEATEDLRKEIAELKRENEQVKEQRNRAHLEAGERYGELLARCNDALRDILLFDADFGDLDEFDCCECKFCAVGDGGCWRGKAIGMQNAILKAKEIMKRQGSRDVRLLS